MHLRSKEAMYCRYERKKSRTKISPEKLNPFAKKGLRFQKSAKGFKLTLSAPNVPILEQTLHGCNFKMKRSQTKIFGVFFKSDFHENAISEGFRSIPESLRTQIQHLFFEKRKISTISKLLFEILGNKTQMSELCHKLSTNITIISRPFDFGCNMRSPHNSCNRSRIDSSNRSLGCGRNESRMITPEPTHPRRLS